MSEAGKGSDDSAGQSQNVALTEALHAIASGDPQERSQALLQVIQMTMQSTRGAYPPPMMMAEYNRIDPAINQQILAEAKAQADHRRGLERLSTERSEKRLDRSQRYQQVVALGSLLIAAAIIALPVFVYNQLPWSAAFAAGLVGAVGIGGRPAASIATSMLARYIGKPSDPG